MISKLLARRAKALIARRGPDFVIGPPDDPYMERWWWIKHNRFLNIYVHRVLKSDDDRALHDHPWASLSLMVETGLIEQYRDASGNTRVRHIDVGRWVYRPARFAHRLIVRPLVSPNDALRPPAITLFITGPKLREWGFLCPNGWRHWKDFVADGNSGEVGRGCGEIE